jgi:transcriptional regulator with XRE-family HTH domain
MDANFFRRRRDELKLTQKQIADKLNLTAAAVSAWETGAGVPRDEIRAAVAEVYQVSLTKLLKEIAEMSASALASK